MKNILVVMNLNMKRLDSWIEFNRAFVKEGAARGYKVEYLLPSAPCAEVLKFFEGSGFRAYIYPGWNSAAEIQDDAGLGKECWKRVREGGYDLVSFHFCNEDAVFAFFAEAAWTVRKPRSI